MIIPNNASGKFGSQKLSADESKSSVWILSVGNTAIKKAKTPPIDKWIMVLILFSIILQWKYFFFYSCKLKQHFCCCLQLIKKSCCHTSANSGHSKEASLPWFNISVSSFFLFITWDFINPHQPPQQSFSTCPYLELTLWINNFIDYAWSFFSHLPFLFSISGSARIYFMSSSKSYQEKPALPCIFYAPLTVTALINNKYW